MDRLYRKDEVWFAVCWILVYVIGTSIADMLSVSVGVVKSVTLVFHLLLIAVVLIWLKKNNLFRKYGLCKSEVVPSKFLYYIPLAVIVTCNLWFGVKWNLSVHETAFYIASMLCVGFLEELIFRGFLFKAMSRDNLRSAIVVSSLTFGIGHIVNLINGSGADLISNIGQVCYAVAFGFLFVILFHRGKSLIPCIAAHGVLNSLSVFADDSKVNETGKIIMAIVLTVWALVYTLILLKTLPKDVKA